MEKIPRSAFRRKTEDQFLITKTLRCIDENVVRDLRYRHGVEHSTKKRKSLFTVGNIYIASAKGTGSWDIENDRDGTIIITAETLQQCFVEVTE